MFDRRRTEYWQTMAAVGAAAGLASETVLELATGKWTWEELSGVVDLRMTALRDRAGIMPHPTEGE